MPPTALRVLIVDDEKLVRVLTSRALVARGIVCDTADDGTAATKLLAETRYDAVLTDLRMPNGNGHLLCQRILAQPDRPLVIVITGLSHPRLFHDLKTRGVDLILRKPLDFVALGTQVRSMIDSRSSARRSTASEASTGDRIATSAAPVQIPTVAILMGKQQRARQVAAGLGADTMTAFAADTTDSLCRFVEEQRVDVILIENVQYGFLDGAEILARIQKASAVPPQAIVIGESDDFGAEQTQSLGIRKVFSSDATDSDLIQAVRSALADTERVNRISQEARTLVKAFKAPAYSPVVLLRLIQYLEMPAADISIAKLSRDIMADPTTTAELLRLANGASLGVRRQISEVSEALNFLGTSRAVSLLVSSGIRNVEGNLLRKLPPDIRTWYQLRTILIASVCSVFAERHFELSGDTAFVLGLFQDIGILVLANAYGDRYLKLIESARSVGPVRLHAIEQQSLHVNHAEVSAALVEQWRLPEKLIRPIHQHHDGTGSSADRNETMAFLQPMQIGEAFADLWDNRHPTRQNAMSNALANCRGGRDSDYQESLAEAVRKTAEVATLFLVPMPDEGEVLAVCKGALAAYSELRDPQAISVHAT